MLAFGGVCAHTKTRTSSFKRKVMEKNHLLEAYRQPACSVYVLSSDTVILAASNTSEHEELGGLIGTPGWDPWIV